MRTWESLAVLLTLAAATGPEVAADGGTCTAEVNASDRPRGFTDLTLLGGRNTRIYPEEIKDAEYLRALFRGTVAEEKGRFRADVFSILEGAGYSAAATQEVIAAAVAHELQECWMPPGGLIEWMSYRSKPGRAEVQKRVRWRGSEAFRAFKFAVRIAGEEHTFFVPAKCGNLGLLHARPSPPPPACLDLVVQSCCVPGGRAAITLAVPGGRKPPKAVAVSSPGGPTWNLSPEGGWSATQYVTPGTALALAAVEEGGNKIHLCTVTLTPTCECPPAPTAACSVAVGAAPSARGWDVSLSTTLPGRLVVRRDQREYADAPSSVPAGETKLQLEDPGRYSFELEASDGAPGKARASCRAEVTLAGERPERRAEGDGWFLAAFLGKERRSRDPKTECAPLASAALGFPPVHVGSAWEIVPAVGVAYNTETTRNSTVYADLRFDKRLTHGRVGLGLGAWDLNHPSTLAPTLAIAGGRVVREGRPGRPAVYLAGEARCFLNKLGDVSNNYQFWLGLRVGARNQ